MPRRPRGSAPQLLIALIRACHPGPTAVVTATMTALAAAAGRGPSTGLVAAAILAGQLSIGWSNDYLDYRRDSLATPAKRSTKPLTSGMLAPHVARDAALIALAVAVILSFATGWRAAIVHVSVIAAAWSYNLGVKGTAASPVPYAVAFGLVPAFVTLGLPGHPWPLWWAYPAGALLGVAAHFANVLPDIQDDLATGVRGLPHRLGVVPTRVISVCLLAGASLLLVLAPAAPIGFGSAGLRFLVAVTVTAATLGAFLAATPWRRASGRYFFPGVVTVAMIDVALLIARGPALYTGS